jgi:WD domain, G-beta repeat
MAALVRERAARALDDDWPQVLAALRRGLEDKDAGKAARTAVAYVQLVYGRQLQQPADEQPADPLDVSRMTREERDALKRRILAQHPHLVRELRRDIVGLDQPFSSVVFSPSGRILATAGCYGDAPVRLWDLHTRKQRPLDVRYVNALAFSPDGRILATGAIDGTIRLWNIAPVRSWRISVAVVGPSLGAMTEGVPLASTSRGRGTPGSGRDATEYGFGIRSPATSTHDSRATLARPRGCRASYRETVSDTVLRPRSSAGSPSRHGARRSRL